MPHFHACLERHIQLDGDEYGPLAIQLLQDLCVGCTRKHAASIGVAEQAWP